MRVNTEWDNDEIQERRERIWSVVTRRNCGLEVHRLLYCERTRGFGGLC